MTTDQTDAGYDEIDDTTPGSAFSGSLMGETATGAGRPITVLLADDHALVREGTRRLLEAEPDMRVVAEAGDGYGAVDEALRTHPDVAIVDVAMPGISGIEATRRIKAQAPRIAILALTAYDDDQYVLALLDAGAAGFLLKDVRGQELADAIRAVHRGEAVLQPTIAVRALKRAASAKSAACLDAAALRARDGGAARGGAWPCQQRHRAAPRTQCAYGAYTSGQHLCQTRRWLAHRSRAVCAAPRLGDARRDRTPADPADG